LRTLATNTPALPKVNGVFPGRPEPSGHPRGAAGCPVGCAGDYLHHPDAEFRQRDPAAVKDLIDVAGVVPAAFCGITGLKTTHGRIPLAGVWPLAPSMDTIGPMARDAAGVAAGLALLEPGFSVDVAAAARIGRIRPTDVDVDPVIDAAVDAALARWPGP
jgi:Amidase